MSSASTNELEQSDAPAPSEDIASCRVGGLDGFDATAPFGGSLGEFLLEQLERDFDEARLSKGFRIFYRLRPFLPIAVRQLLQKARNGKAEVPKKWYLPTDLLELIDQQSPPDSIWPDNNEFAFVLTHDVETQRGVGLVEQLAAVEEEFGFRSSWNFVPHKYTVDAGLLADLRSRGFEIGLHGYNHDGRTFLSRNHFSRRLPAMNAAFEKWQAEGFRSPMVHRNLAWMQDLNVTYDSSCFDVDPFQAMPGGIQSFWPLRCGKFIELPYTMPQDHTLFITLGETTDRIWREKLDVIRRCRGMAMMLTHPDYLDTPDRLAVYRDFLAYAAEPQKYWHALPHQVASHARSLMNATISS